MVCLYFLLFINEPTELWESNNLDTVFTGGRLLSLIVRCSVSNKERCNQHDEMCYDVTMQVWPYIHMCNKSKWNGTVTSPCRQSWLIFFPQLINTFPTQFWALWKKFPLTSRGTIFWIFNFHLRSRKISLRELYFAFEIGIICFNVPFII